MAWTCITHERQQISEGRRRRRGRKPEIKWEREAERVMKQKNLTPEDAVNR
jgi:hypothetical protein